MLYITGGDLASGVLLGALGVGLVLKLSALQTFVVACIGLTIVVFGCSALSHFSISHEDPPSVTLEKWKRRMKKEDAVEEVLKAAVESLRDGGERMLAEWLSGGFVPLVLQTLETHSESDGILSLILACFTMISKVPLGRSVILGDADLEAMDAEVGDDMDFSGNTSTKDDGATDGDLSDQDDVALDIVDDALDSKPATPLQHVVLCVRASLLRDKEATQTGKATIEADHVESDPAMVQKQACLFFAALCDEDSEVADEMGDEGCIDAILDSMIWFELHAAIQQWGCLALFNLIFQNPGNKLYLFQRGGLKPVMNAIRQHADHMEVQRQGIAMLFSLLQSSESPGQQGKVSDFRSNAFSMGLEGILENAVSRWSDNHEIVAMGTELIKSAQEHYSGKPEFDMAGSVGFEVLKQSQISDTKSILAPTTDPSSWQIGTQLEGKS